MNSIDVWFILWGIVLAFFLQVLYDGFGGSHVGRKFWSGLMLGLIMSISLILWAYPLVGLYAIMGLLNTVLMWFCLSVLIILTSIFWLISINKIRPRSPNLITKKQAIELADKYLMYNNKYALRDNIFATKKNQKWQIVAVTTPIILGMDFEWHSFPIDMETGEVGAAMSITITLPIADVLRQIRERKDLEKAQMEQVRAKVAELQGAIKKMDTNRLRNLKKWFKDNAPYLKSVLDFITAVLNHIK